MSMQDTVIAGMTYVPKDEHNFTKEEGFYLARQRTGERGRNVVVVPMRDAWEFLDDQQALDKTEVYMDILFGKGGWIKSEHHQMVDLCRNLALDSLAMKPPSMDYREKNMLKRLERDQAVIKLGDETILDTR